MARADMLEPYLVRCKKTGQTYMGERSGEITGDCHCVSTNSCAIEKMQAKLLMPISAELRTVTTHYLKTLPPYWEAIDRGEKNFEVRRDDLGFQKGDILVLCYFDEYMGEDKSKQLTRRVTWILTGGQLGIEPGYVVMALEKVDKD